ncbi:MAG: VOC family protein [Actinomycetota bacterium]|nr:VOC family protein [Actinomycetota bacterium]MED5232033.1 VOC family protein [Actinomycetota bacterium]MED5394905.1 VOC family protein [Actinomycetota bacterium]
MTVRLRQVALVVRDLPAVSDEVAGSLGVEACAHDLHVEQFGLHNALFPVGEGLLELVSPFRDGTTAGRFLDQCGGDAGYMVLFQVDDLEAVRGRVAGLGVRVVLEVAQPGIVGLHLHPRDLGGAIVSVDQTDRWDDWPWAGANWRDHVRTDLVSGLATVEVAVAEPEAAAERWAAVLGVDAVGAAVPLDEGEVCFVSAEDRIEHISGLELWASRHEDLVIGGVEMALRPRRAAHGRSDEGGGPAA